MSGHSRIEGSVSYPVEHPGGASGRDTKVGDKLTVGTVEEDHIPDGRAVRADDVAITGVDAVVGITVDATAERGGSSSISRTEVDQAAAKCPCIEAEEMIRASRRRISEACMSPVWSSACRQRRVDLKQFGDARAITIS
jgi:hypothetical protein